MADDRRDLPPRNDGFTRFIGGSPLGVLGRLIILSVLVGVVMSVFGLDPRNILYSIRVLILSIWDMGFDAITGLWGYFLLGAVIVIPLWLLTRLFSASSRR